MTNPNKKPRTFWIHCSYSCGQGGWDYIVSDAEPKYKQDEKYHVIEHSAYDALAKENEELKLALFDRSEKYKIAMDKGVLQLGDEIKSLRYSLKLAIAALDKISSNGRVACMQLKQAGIAQPADSVCFLISSLELFADNALAKIKTKHGEL